MANNISYEDYMKLKPASKAIHKAYIDFGDTSEDAKKNIQREVERFRGVKVAWESTRMHFFTESIHPDIASPERPRVMLLFSNPLPESVCEGLFMSEKRSRGFWEIVRGINQLGINYDFCWDEHGIQEAVSLLLNGDYGNRRSPLLFFDCLYQIPSKAPDDLRKLFCRRSGDFDRYLRRPSLERIGRIINRYDIKTVLVFEGDTFESIIGERGISKGYREILCSAVRGTIKEKKRNKEVFWEQMDEHKLRRQVDIPDLNHSCTAIKVMNTRAKDWWKNGGRSIFSWVLEYALEYATEAT